MKTVNFTEMKNGTKEEYLLLDRYEQKYIEKTADGHYVPIGLTEDQLYKLDKLCIKTSLFVIFLSFDLFIFTLLKSTLIFGNSLECIKLVL